MLKFPLSIYLLRLVVVVVLLCVCKQQGIIFPQTIGRNKNTTHRRRGSNCHDFVSSLKNEKELLERIDEGKRLKQKSTLTDKKRR